MIKAVIFDFDGLILDTETAWYEAYKETMVFINLICLSNILLNVSEQIILNFISSSKKNWGKVVILKKLKPEQKSLHKVKMKTSQAREGVKDYLEEAENFGYKIALASSSTKEWVTHYLGELGLLNYFEVIITGDDVDKVKPAPDLYLKAIEVLNIHSTEAVAFEDSLNGLQSALNAGLKCVIVPNPVTEALAFENHSLRLQSMVEKSLTDVIKLIEQ